MRRLLALVALTVAIAAPAASAAPKPLKVSLTAQSPHPVLHHTWWYQVKVTDSAGKPVACLIHVQVTFNGVPVGEVGKHQRPDGLWKETIPAKGVNAFPPAAVGQHIVWRATVTAPGYRKAIANMPISVVK
jgi:hypothetical protein